MDMTKGPGLEAATDGAATGRLYSLPSPEFPVRRVPPDLVQEGCLSHGRLNLCFQRMKGGQRVRLVPVVFQVCLNHNNQYVKVTYFRVTYSEPLHPTTESEGR